jgi:hypothetical protein
MESSIAARKAASDGVSITAMGGRFAKSAQGHAIKLKQSNFLRIGLSRLELTVSASKHSFH